jgi:hypothetical protein
MILIVFASLNVPGALNTTPFPVLAGVAINPSGRYTTRLPSGRSSRFCNMNLDWSGNWLYGTNWSNGTFDPDTYKMVGSFGSTG